MGLSPPITSMRGSPPAPEAVGLPLSGLVRVTRHRRDGPHPAAITEAVAFGTARLIPDRHRAAGWTLMVDGYRSRT